MPARQVKILPRDVRGADALVAGREFRFLRKLFELLDDGARRAGARAAGRARRRRRR